MMGRKSKIDINHGTPLNTIPMWMVLHYSGKSNGIMPFVLRPGENPIFAGTLIMDPITTTIWGAAIVNSEEDQRRLGFDALIDSTRSSIITLDFTGPDKDVLIAKRVKEKGKQIAVFIDTEKLGEEPDKMIVTLPQGRGKESVTLYAEKLLTFEEELKKQVPNYDEEKAEYEEFKKEVKTKSD